MVGEANALLNWLTVILLGLVFFYRWHKRATRPSSLVEAPSSTVLENGRTSMQF
jgi:hypothetical protein